MSSEQAPAPAASSAAALPGSVDVVVIGAGHNGLVAAGYLAAAGLEVLVLEAGALPGGDTVTEELTLPGFAHDSCSSAHVLIQSNPLLRDDELALLSKHGLEYVRTDPAVVMPQDDGDSLVMHRDLNATADEIARWSPKDAVAFREMVGEWTGGLAAMHGRWSSGLELGDTDAARRYQDLRRRSAWDVVHERFTHPAIRDFVLWMAMATIQDPRRPGTGFLPSSLTVGRLTFGWSTPLGGSGALPNALVGQIESHGGRVVCSPPVTQVEVSGGRATAVLTADGVRVAARRAVRLQRPPGPAGRHADRHRRARRPGRGAGALAAGAQRVRGPRGVAARPPVSHGRGARPERRRRFRDDGRDGRSDRRLRPRRARR